MAYHKKKENPHVCDICGKSYTGQVAKKNLKDHILEKHPLPGESYLNTAIKLRLHTVT